MTAQTVASLPAAQRAVYSTRKHRAEDLQAGDVTRNRYGKWARITKVERTEGLYVYLHFDTGDPLLVRDVHLVDVQTVKPS